MPGGKGMLSWLGPAFPSLEAEAKVEAKDEWQDRDLAKYPQRNWWRNCVPSQQEMSLKCSRWNLASLIPICSYQMWGYLTVEAKPNSSSRPELAPQTNSSELLLLNNEGFDKCTTKWIQSSQGERLRSGLKSPREAPHGLSRETFVLGLLASLFRERLMGFSLWDASGTLSRVLPGKSQGPTGTWLAWNGRGRSTTQLVEPRILSPGRYQSLPWPEQWSEKLGLVLSFFCSYFFTHPQDHCVTRALLCKGGMLGDSKTLFQSFLNLLFLHHNWPITCPISNF